MLNLEAVVKTINDILKKKYTTPENKELYLMTNGDNKIKMYRFFYGDVNTPMLPLAPHVKVRHVEVLFPKDDASGLHFHIGFGTDVSKPVPSDIMAISYNYEGDKKVDISDMILDIHNFLFDGVFPITHELLH